MLAINAMSRVKCKIIIVIKDKQADNKGCWQSMGFYTWPKESLCPYNENQSLQSATCCNKKNISPNVITKNICSSKHYNKEDMLNKWLKVKKNLWQNVFILE